MRPPRRSGRRAPAPPPAEAGHPGLLQLGGTLGNTARLLDAIASRGPLSVAEIASALGVDRTTGWRLARRLLGLGWLHLDDRSGRYEIGLRLFEIGSRALDTYDLRNEWRRVMGELVASTGESADVAVLDGDTALFIDKVDGTHEVRAFTRIGQRVPLHAVAVGKVFLAYLPDDRLEALLAHPLRRFTPNTIVDAEELRRVVTETRVRGWAMNRGELHREAGGLAVPVLDSSGGCTFALGLNVPLTRLDDLDGLVARLQQGARALSRPGAGRTT